jgi:hypothetical protein
MGKKEDISRVGKSRLTAVIIRVEGSDETLQEGFRTLSEALNGLVKPISLPAHKEPAQLPPAGADAPRSSNGEPGLDDAIQDSHEAERSQPSRPQKFRSPNVIQLDLSTGDVPLKKFIEEKHLTDTDPDTKRYLAIAVWLKNNLKLVEISTDHIHTCYRHMNWRTPKNAAQPLRTMKSVNGWFDKGNERGFYAINHIGENEVMAMAVSQA